MNNGQAKPRRRYVQGARAEAAEATGRRIVEAFLARLMAQWFDEITLDRIAADAGVTVQTVVRRFGSKEGLLEGAVETLTEQIHARRGPPSGDLTRRVQGLVEDYEHTGDAVTRLLALEPRHPSLSRFVNIGRKYHREWAAGLLKELGGPAEGAPRTRALDALVIATDVYTWKLLRRDMGRSLAATIATVESLVSAAIRLHEPHSTGVER